MRTRHAAGSASALLGTSSFLIGAVASPLVGIAGEAHGGADGRGPAGVRARGGLLLPGTVPAVAAEWR